MPMQTDKPTDQFRRLIVLIAVATVDMVGGAMVFPLIPFYALKFHASPQVIGMIASANHGPSEPVQRALSSD